MASVSTSTFSSTSGRTSTLTQLQTRSGYRLDVLDYGATVVRLFMPDRAGTFSDIVLGYDDLDGYLDCTVFLGATIGRVANRIAHGRFELDGASYELARSDPPHHLHGGKRGWDKVDWQSTASADDGSARVELTYTSPDGEEGYPARVDARTVYTLSETGEVRIEMSASADRRTVVNMCHHSYFNLAGHDTGSVKDHELTLFCDEYTPGAAPDGRVAPVEGTLFDFREARRVGDAIDRSQATPPGLDQNLLVRGAPGTLRQVAHLAEPTSGRVLDLFADQPAVQLYTGNFLDGSSRGKGASHLRHGAICLESQAIPNAINVEKWRDQVLLAPGQVYRHEMMLKFGTT